MKACPACGCVRAHTIDKGHLSLTHMDRPSNTLVIYQCRECGTMYDSQALADDITMPVDFFFDRPRQYTKARFFRVHTWWCPWLWDKSTRLIRQIEAQNMDDWDDVVIDHKKIGDTSE